jgi:hypothetical protein
MLEYPGKNFAVLHVRMSSIYLNLKTYYATKIIRVNTKMRVLSNLKLQVNDKQKFKITCFTEALRLAD